MRPATLHDLPGVYRVCRLTGAAGRDATSRHADPDLLGHVWAGPYLVAPDGVALVLHDDAGVAGYAVGVPDTARFEDWLETEWLPPLRDRLPRGSGATGADRELVERIHRRPGTPAELVAAYPAHLHVDLLPRAQGTGWGRRLVERLLDLLAGAGATGVHLGVDAENAAAIGFYEALGFSELGSDGGGRLYGMPLPHRR
jgi:GNAT superfamily N-acetyltransferase